MHALVSRFAADGSHTLDLTELPIPEPGPGQVRIKVSATTVNPVDLNTAKGLLAAGGLHPPREVLGLGWDVAGTIDALGASDDASRGEAVGETAGEADGEADRQADGASVASGAGAPHPARPAYEIGDAVIGLADVLDVDSAAHADYVVLDLHQIAPTPRGVDPVAAATLPLNALTARQALDRLALTPGQTLLITGAAGGVGGFAVELAARRGLHVVANAGAGDEELVRDFGARWFVPRGVARLAAAVRAYVPGGVDAALDAAPVGSAAVLGAIRSHGAYTSIAGGEFVPLRGITTSSTWITADAAQLAELSHLASTDVGALTLRVAETYALADAAKAYARLAEGNLRGRLVLIP